jgi:hypothetical protein
MMAVSLQNSDLAQHSINKGAQQVSEVQILCQELTEKFGLKCWPKLNKQKYCIMISGHSFDHIISLLRPWLAEAQMAHKLTKRARDSHSEGQCDIVQWN